MLQKPRFDIEVLERRDVPAFLASEFAFTPPLLDIDEVQQLLQRASAATGSDDAIIAIVDRAGNILGVRVEGGVSATIQGSPDLEAFAIDGAVAKARTAAFFASDQAPLTSRTIRNLSQSTVTEREVESNPNDNNPNSTERGPGYIAAVSLGAHFPPGVNFTPPVDLFGIEHTNRDSLLHPGADHLKGTADDIPLDARFNIDTAFVPVGQELSTPLSYAESILTPADLLDPTINHYQSRGIATLPGGIPLYEYGVLVGGIGVFFPGETGFATEENSSMSATFDPTKADRTLEAEFIALAALGGSSELGLSVGALGGVAPVQGFNFPGGGRIDLVGITLDIIGPGGDNGPTSLVNYAQMNLGVGMGDPNSGTDVPVDSGGNPYKAGVAVPQGWLVTPHDGVNLTAAQVEQMITQGIEEANKVRAQIRLPNDQKTRMVFAVTDVTGEVLGLYRMPDATVFSIDVAVAKARNLSYYNDATQLQAIDQVMGAPPGTAMTNRTIRFLSGPRYPDGIDGQFGPFSILNDPGINTANGLLNGAPLPASVYQSVYGFDSFNPGTNFRDPSNIANQNGVVFFPGSSGIYTSQGLVGGLGVSGDGVDQDDVITAFGIAGFDAPSALRADQYFVRGVRLPYLKFPRNPEG